jgi:MFS transporter, PAT family, beta-lactamase induction signal transducer AmpG
MDNTKTRNNRFFLFALIYFVEGAILTYFSFYNTPFLRTFDLPFSQIGIVSGVAMIPLILKIVIGYISDRVSLFKQGHRKPYILLGLVLQTTAFLLISLINPVEQFGIYVFLMIMASTGMSTYDTTTDGLSIDTTPEKDRGMVQGLMVGGRALSMVVMGSLMGHFSELGEWNMIFYIIAGLGLLAILLTLPIKDSKDRAPEMEYSKEAFASFKDVSFFLFIILGLVYPLALYSSQGMISSFLHEGLNINMSIVGIYTSVFGIGTVVGGIVGGPLMKKFGERTSIIAAMLITSAVTFVLAITPSAGILWGVVFFFGAAFGYYETVYLAMGMDFADPRIAAFMFSIIMAFGNIGIGAGAPLAGVLVEKVGFRPMFAIFATIHLLALPIVIAIFRTRKKAIEA